MGEPTMLHRLAAEFIGTFWLVLGGCGSAVFAAKFIPTALARHRIPRRRARFRADRAHRGLRVRHDLRAAISIPPSRRRRAGPARRVEALPAYWIAQVVGGVVGRHGHLRRSPRARTDWTATGNLAANGYGEHSPGGYSLLGVLITEVVLTGVFLLVILGATDDRAPKGFAGIAIGLTLTLIHLISIPISNTSVNPARSTAVAFFNGDGAPASCGCSGWRR